MIILIIFISCIISAILYRAGGMDKLPDTNPKWMPRALRHSWCRDWLCPAVFLLLMLYFYRPSSLLDWIMLLPYYLLSGGALSLYWDDSKNKFLDKICKIINWKYPQDNYYLHGGFCGLAGFCLISFVPWLILLARLIFCTLGMGILSKIITFDETEEESRGILFII